MRARRRPSAADSACADRRDSRAGRQTRTALQAAPAAATRPVYYFAQKNGESQRVEGTEKNRHDLLQAVAEGAVRKVLVKYDVSLVEERSLENILDQLQEALVALEPYYLATRQV